MSEKKDSKTYLGLDIGVGSVGWCVTDENYNIKKFHGKDAWGVRLFDKASDAKSRRFHRSTRRRLDRRRYRINILNNIFSEELAKVDDTFLLRLKDSGLLLEDKSDKAKIKYPLFINKRDEKNYYRTYPTIYHLRKALVNNDNKAFSDPRNVYLGIHHILKNRGNFVNDGGINNLLNIKPDLIRLNEILNNILRESEYGSDGEEGDNFDIVCNPADASIIFDSAILNKDLSSAGRKSMIGSIFDAYKIKEIDSSLPDKFMGKIFPQLVTSGKANFKNFNDDSDLNIDLKKITNVDEIPNLNSILDENLYEIVAIAKKMCDYASNKKIMSTAQENEGSGENDKFFISDFYIAVYKKHHEQLENLKDIVKYLDKTNPGLYDKVFNEVKEIEGKKKAKPINYYAFITRDSKLEGRKRQSDFCNFINTNVLTKENVELLKNNIDLIKSRNNKNKITVEKIDKLVEDCEEKNLLSKISDESTSAIPHQFHHIELIEILKNIKHRQDKNYQFSSIDTELIEKLFLTKINYFYGPLDNEAISSGKSNIVLKEEYKGKPVNWLNFKDAIDEKATKREFIHQRLNYCTYLNNETVLPRMSLKYIKFDIYNKLNLMQFGQSKLSSEEKKYAFELVTRQTKYPVKKIINQLNERFIGLAVDEAFDIFSGLDKESEFVSTPFPQFLRIYGGMNAVEANISEIERIIQILTVYKDNPKDGLDLVKEELKRINPNSPVLTNPKNEKELANIKFTGYGKLSEKFIDGIKGNNGKTILETLADTNEPFNTIYSKPEYGFRGKVEKENAISRELSKKEITENLLEAMPPASRRPVIQSLKIVDEIMALNKEPIDRIFIETTREEDPKKKNKKTKSRHEIINEFLKNVIGTKKEKSNPEFKEKAKELQEILRQKDEKELNGKALYLYFMQLGYDLYTGEPIEDVNDIFNTNKYNIDHIIPKALRYDDSLDNTVLVSAEKNKEKDKNYPLTSSIRNKETMKIWRFLHKKKLMSDAKYARLMRTAELTEEELRDFTNSELNATSYANKKTRQIIESLYSQYGTKVEYSKAQYVSEMRKRFELYKLRDLNDCHHAHDAYFNIVCGNLVYEKYALGNMSRFYVDRKTRKKVEQNYYKTYNITSFLERIIRNSDLVDKMTENYLRTDMFVTYKQSYGDSAFYNLKMSKKGDSSSLTALHDKGIGTSINSEIKYDVGKYGGYNSLSTKCYVVVYNLNNKKEKPRLYNVNVLDYELSREKNKQIDPILLEKNIRRRIALRHDSNVENFKICTDKLIPLSSIVAIGDSRYLLKSGDKDNVALYPLFYVPSFSKEQLIYLQRALKFEQTWNTQLLTYNTNATIDHKTGEVLRYDTCSITSEKNLEMYKFITSFIQDSHYSAYSIAKKYKIVSDDDFIAGKYSENSDEKEDANKNKKNKNRPELTESQEILRKQIVIIKKALAIFARNSSLIKHPMRSKADAFIKKYNPEFIETSITGFHTKKKKI